MNKYKDFLSTISRYQGFTFPLVPIRPFVKIAKQMNIDVVQVHCFDRSTLDNLGFVGAFSWKNQTIIPLDGDSYSKETLVYGYKFSKEKDKIILDIIVDEENW